MSRGKGHTGAVSHLRSGLDASMLAQSNAVQSLQLIRLRVEQGIERSGLQALLHPAIDEADFAIRELSEARRLIEQASHELVSGGVLNGD